MKVKDAVDKNNTEQTPLSDFVQEKKGALSRRKIRSLVVHLLYTLEAHEYTITASAAADMFNRGFDTKIMLKSDAVIMAQGIADRRNEFDRMIEPMLVKWRLDRIGCCTRLILYFALWELLHTEIPSNIVINEAIELAKCFSEKDAYKFVNGVLDEVCKNFKADRKS